GHHSLPSTSSTSSTVSTLYPTDELNLLRCYDYKAAAVAAMAAASIGFTPQSTLYHLNSWSPAVPTSSASSVPLPPGQYPLPPPPPPPPPPHPPLRRSASPPPAPPPGHSFGLFAPYYPFGPFR